jgi:hypothetical protein
MNLYIFEMIIKFLRMLFVAIISIFNIGLYNENENITKNNIIDQKVYAVNTVYIEEPKIEQNKINNVNTNTTKNNAVNKPVTNNNVSSNKIPTVNKSTEQTNINTEQKNEQSTTIAETNNVITTEKPVEVPVNSTIETYTGRLTGYGPDCAGCSGYGGLACRTKEKTSFSLKTNGIYYTDSEYGKVRILAAATSKFTCGTIIKVTKPGQTPFTAVVLDTGGSMRKAWANGSVWMDLAYESEAMAGSDNLTGTNIKFEVQRYGW